MSVAKKEIVTFKPGDMVVQDKTPCDAIFIVQQGQLEVFKTKGEEKIPLGMINSGEYIGEMALLLEKPHASNVVALTEVKAVKLPAKALEGQMEKVPAWFLGMIRGMADRLHTANEVLRRNNLIDELIKGQIQAIEEKNKHHGGDAT